MLPPLLYGVTEALLMEAHEVSGESNLDTCAFCGVLVFWGVQLIGRQATAQL
jgi:hypothetical protein